MDQGVSDSTAGRSATADPLLLIPLMFNDDRKTSGSGKKINNSNKSENVDLLVAASDGQMGSSSLENRQFRKTRVSVGRGPLRPDGGLRATGGYEVSNAGEASGISPMQAIPLRFVSRKSRTALTAPTSFDERQMKRSAQPPSSDCVR
jgi:hypothetical protein